MIDEAWLLVEIAAALDFLNAIVRRARKYYLGVVLISQQAADFCNQPLAQALLSQTSLRILLHQDSTQIKALKKQFNLSPTEAKFLSQAAAGEALIMANGQHVITQIKATPAEHDLITTKPKEIYD